MGVPRFRISLNHSPNRRTIRLSADEESGARFLPATSNVTDILIKPARVEGGRKGERNKGGGDDLRGYDVCPRGSIFAEHSNVFCQLFRPVQWRTRILLPSFTGFLPVSITRLPNFPTYFPAEGRIFLRAFKTFLIALNGVGGACELQLFVSIEHLVITGWKGGREKCLRRNWYLLYCNSIS